MNLNQQIKIYHICFNPFNIFKKVTIKLNIFNFENKDNHGRNDSIFNDQNTENHIKYM